MAKLGEYASFIMGQAPASSDCNTDGVGTPFVKAGQFGKSVPIIDEWTTNPLKMASSEDVLICVVGATSGKLNRGVDCAIGRSVAAIRPNREAIRDYIYYGLHPWIQRLRGGSQGSAIGVITKDMLDVVEMPFPDVKCQKEIVQILSSIECIIQKREVELGKLDELIKARFVELFGTLDNPSQEFEKATLKELCNKITDGKHGGCAQEEGTDRYFVGAREIFDDEVHYETAPQINIEEFEKDYKRCNVEIGDFLIVNTGATIGKSAIASDIRTEHTLLQKSVALLKVKREVLNPVFLKWCYRVNTKMYLVENASAQPNLLLSKINSTVIYVPDISLQKQFAGFVEQVDKSKVAVQKSLDETQILFDSLMQEYFG